MELWSTLIENTYGIKNHDKENALEDLVNCFFNCIDGFKITGKTLDISLKK